MYKVYTHFCRDLLVAQQNDLFIIDVFFLEKYETIDKLAFTNACKIILKGSPYMIQMCFEPLFYQNDLNKIVVKFTEDISLLEDIYLAICSCDPTVDMDGHLLKEIYLASPTILNKCLDMDVVSDSFSHPKSKYCCFLDMDNYIEIFDSILDRLISDCIFSVSDFLDALLSSDNPNPVHLQRQNEWLEHCIASTPTDMERMNELFSSISNLDIERKTKMILLFLKHNESFDNFKQLPLLPNFTERAIGSSEPIYSRIEYLESLLPFIKGAKHLQHKKYIQQKIDSLKMKIKDNEVIDLLRMSGFNNGEYTIL